MICQRCGDAILHTPAAHTALVGLAWTSSQRAGFNAMAPCGRNRARPPGRWAVEQVHTKAAKPCVGEIDVPHPWGTSFASLLDTMPACRVLLAWNAHVFDLDRPTHFRRRAVETVHLCSPKVSTRPRAQLEEDLSRRSVLWRGTSTTKACKNKTRSDHSPTWVNIDKAGDPPPPRWQETTEVIQPYGEPVYVKKKRGGKGAPTISAATQRPRIL